ncbi:MAG: ATP-grasp domain-containing protein [Hansschlegelia sp.]
MSSPSTSRPEFDLAVVALSARALAGSARRAELRALAIDLFADGDTRELAAEAVRVRSGRRGFEGPALLDALRTHAPEGLPVVLGAGFEHAPSLMRAIAERNPVLGASPETVRRLKRPDRLASLLAEAGVAHPEIRPAHSAPPPDGAWLSKRIGASGGAHIRPAGGAAQGRYLQRRVEGRSISALFLADGASARVVGFSEQWLDPAPGAPFRYGGAVGPIALPADLAAQVAADLDRITRATGLVGLASADMIVPEGGPSYWMLEINPRPGATLDVFDRGDMPSLLRLHIDAFEGRLPASLPAPVGAQAAAVLYAGFPVSAASIERPVWTTDWPSCEEVVPAGAPVCSIVAAAASPSAARALLDERRAALQSLLRAARPPLRRANRMVPA